MAPRSAAGSTRSGLNFDADTEAGIAGTRARNEAELLGMAAPTLDNNPRLIDPSRTLTPDQRVAQESSARQLAEAVQRIPNPPADLQTLEEVVVVGSRGGDAGLSMRPIDQSFMSSAWDSWSHSWGSKLRDLKHAVNGPGPLIDPHSVIDAGKGALSYVADNLMMAVPGSSYFEFGQDAEQRLRDRYSSMGDRVERAADESWGKINLFAETLREGDTASAGWMWGETVSDVQAWAAEEGAYVAGGFGLARLSRAGALAGERTIAGGMLDEIAVLPPGSRPNPASYLSPAYVESHLAQFEGGASYLTPKAALDYWGRDVVGRADGQFVMPSSQLDEVLLRSNGDLASIETELGIPAGSWQGREFVRIDIPKPQALELRMPSGNESGANPLWRPGGRLPTGYSEAVVNPIPRGVYTEDTLAEAMKKLVR